MMSMLAMTRPAAKTALRSARNPMRFKSSSSKQATTMTTSTTAAATEASGGSAAAASSSLMKTAAKALRAVGFGPTARSRAQQKITRSRYTARQQKHQRPKRTSYERTLF